MQSTSLPSSQRKNKKFAGSLFATLFLVGVSVIIWSNFQFILDTISYWRYQPNSSIVMLTDKVKLTDSGKFTFYATHPVLDGNRTFSAKCESKEQSAAILGCYVADRIYLFDVADERLDGIEEVTAVHEMLHAVYQRMSDSERTKLNKMIEAEYENLRTDENLSERMAYYARTEPGERDNELHSIIGTEVRTISPALEAHYAKYIKNRAMIVGFYESYRQAFTSLEEQKNALSAQLDGLSDEIKTATETYNSKSAQLKADVASFNQRAESGGFASQAQFNRERAQLIANVDTLNAERDAINAKVVEYNRLKDQYNATILQSNDLYKSIDSNLAPAPQV